MKELRSKKTVGSWNVPSERVTLQKLPNALFSESVQDCSVIYKTLHNSLSIRSDQRRRLYNSIHVEKILFSNICVQGHVVKK